MAKIREYNNQQNFSGDSFGTAARTQEVAGYQSGLAIKQGFNQIAQGVKETEEHIAQNEMSKMAAELATAHAELQTQWNEAVRTADPNDHELSQRFMEKNVKPRLSKIGEGLITNSAQQMFTKSSAGLSAELFTRSSADQAHLAGEAAITNLDTVKNQLSNVARADPSSMKNVLGLADMSIDGLVAQYGLSREDALKLSKSVKSEIAKSAAYGAADLNPQAAKSALERGDYNDHLDGTTVKTIINYADQRQKDQEAAKRAAEAEQRRADDDAANTAATQISTSLIDPETGVERLPPDYFQNITKYGQMPGAKDGTVRAMRAAGEQMMRSPILVSDTDTKTNFLGRIWLGNDDPSRLSLADVDSAFGVGLLNKADHTMMRQSIMDADKDPNKAQNMRSLKQAEQSFKSYISKSNMLVSDKDGDVRYGQFIEEKDRQFQAAIKAGIPAKDLLDPRSKDYVFRDAQRYAPQADLKRFQDNIQGNAPPIGPPSVVPWASAPTYTGNVNRPLPGRTPSTLPQRQPGESAADFLKRAK